MISAAAFWFSAFLSPERSLRKEVFKLFRPRNDVKVAFPLTQPRLVVALAALGVVMGLAIAGGAAPGSIFFVLAAMGACTVSRVLISGKPAGASALWIITMGWSMLTGASRFGTTDLGEIAGAQSVLGPAVLLRPTLATGVSVAAVLIGSIAGVFWIQTSPRIEGEEGHLVDTALRWGETALVAFGFAALAFGPIAGGLAYGPYEPEMLLRTGGSLAAAVAALIIVSWFRRAFRRFEGKRAAAFFGPLSFATLIVILLVK